MNFASVQRILGVILTIFSLTMVPPMIIGGYFHEGSWWPFAESFGLLLLTGLALWLPVYRSQRDLKLRDGFLIVALFWPLLALASATPLIFGEDPGLGFTDAAFEAVAGITTTNASVIRSLARLPQAMLWYRQQLQWLGGIGAVVLSIALFPMLGIGGMQLYKSDTPGPLKDERLSPRIAQTARALSGIYLLLTLACAAAYAGAGMSTLEAIEHAFSTVSTGGFSTHDGGFAYFKSPAIDMVAVLFMFLGGVNFALHYAAWRSKNVGTYFGDPQFRVYLSVTLGVAALVAIYLISTSTYTSPLMAMRYGLFEAVSMQSTTGFEAVHFNVWPGMLPTLLMLVTFVGGSAGSTAGGMKIIRWQLVLKQAQRELARIVHPNASLLVKFADKRVPGRVLAAVTGFFAMYLLLFALMMLGMLATGVDQTTAWSAVATCLNNAGGGLGSVAAGFHTLPVAAKWLAVVAMLIGRLEVFTIIVVFTPTFWRH
jgi:trk system potassium uptake protein TrkH